MGTKKESDSAKALGKSQEVVLGGKKRKLVYNLYSFCKLDEETGVNILAGDGLDTMRPRDLVALVWCGLVNDEPDLTIDEVAKTVDLAEIMALPQLIQAGFANAMPEADEEKKTEPLTLEPVEN